jgi:hypothetical protein
MEKQSLLKSVFNLKKEVGKMTKDSTNPFFKSKYFDINQLLEHLEPLAEKNNLVILQPIVNNHVRTEILHVETGEMIFSEIELTGIKDPQKIGSEVTYFRRYTLQSLLSIQAEDDDGNKTQAKPQATQPQIEVTWLSAEQFNMAMKSDAKGIEATLKAYSTETKKMKKEYKEQLELQLLTLKK